MTETHNDHQRLAAPRNAFLKRLLAQTHVVVYHASRGSIGHHLGKTTVLLLTTMGRKTGKRRVMPIAYFRDGARYILVASNYGAATDPSWWRNLQAHPEATIQVGSQSITVQATAAMGMNGRDWHSLPHTIISPMRAISARPHARFR